MTQIALPIQDVTSWPTGTFADLADGSDATFVQSAQGPTNSPMVVKLAALIDPASSTGHILHGRWQKDDAAASALTGTAEIRQDYLSEGSKGTLIATAQNAVTVAHGWVEFDYTLSGPEADAITDYGSLYARFVANS